jgi:membrane-bound lytic murein transglycosylase F
MSPRLLSQLKFARRQLRWAVPWGIVLALLLNLMTCSPPLDQVARIQAGGALKVATVNSPTTYYESSSGPSGFDHDATLAFADWLGVALELVVVNSNEEALQAVATGKAHLAAAGIAITPERQQQFRFGPVVQTVRSELVYRMGNRRPDSLDTLEGTLRVAGGSEQAARLTELAQQHPTLRWDEAGEQETEALLHAVEQGKLDYTVVHSTLLAVYQRIYPRLRSAFSVSDDQPLAWAMARHRDRSLLHATYRFFGQLDSDVWTDLQARHFGGRDPLDFVSTVTLAEHFDTRLPDFRAHFEKAGDTYGIDWRLLAAVGYQESHWNPRAVSPTGVTGLMMLTRATAEFLGVTDRNDPAQSIDGGARYLRRFLDHFASVPEPDRLYLALTAYNLGLGHVLDLRTLTELRGGNPDSWADLRKNLPLLTQRQWYTRTRYGYARGFEALHYVKQVRTYHTLLTWKTDNQANRDAPPPEPLDEGDDMVPAPRSPSRSPLQVAPPLL